MKIWGTLIATIALAATTQAAKITFETVDSDKDGKVSLKEYSELVKARFAQSEKEGYEQAAAKQFKKKDTNADGFLSKDEFSIKPKK